MGRGEEIGSWDKRVLGRGIRGDVSRNCGTRAQGGAWRRALGKELRGLRRRYVGRDRIRNCRWFGSWDKRVLGRELRGEVSRSCGTRAQGGAWRRALGEGPRGLRRRYEGRDHRRNSRRLGRWDKRVLGRGLCGEVRRSCGIRARGGAWRRARELGQAGAGQGAPRRGEQELRHKGSRWGVEESSGVGTSGCWAGGSAER